MLPQALAELGQPACSSGWPDIVGLGDMFQWMEILAPGLVAQAVLAISIVAAVGLALGSIGFRGIRLGAAGVLYWHQLNPLSEQYSQILRDL